MDLMQKIAAPLIIQHFCSILLKGEGLDSAERFLDFLKKLESCCIAHPEIEEFISSPRTPFKHINAFLKDSAKDLKLPEDLLGPLEVMAEFHLFNHLSAVIKRLEDVVLAEKGITNVTCISAQALDEKTQEDVMATLKDLGVTQPKFENHVDHALLKGYKLIWNHKIYDKTLKKSLDTLYQTLIGATT